MATAGIGSAPWVAAGTSWAERRGVFKQKTTRRELELVRDARPGRAFAHEEAIRRGVPETGRTPVERVIDGAVAPSNPGHSRRSRRHQAGRLFSQRGSRTSVCRLLRARE
jgi:hypothetical protein